jgi:bifunctional NMN adenylyltransferase/nudix hydrolase
VITHAFLLELEPGPLPAIVGMDDAASAAWHEISSLRVDSLFEDHAFVIQSLLKKGS